LHSEHLFTFLSLSTYFYYYFPFIFCRYTIDCTVVLYNFIIIIIIIIIEPSVPASSLLTVQPDTPDSRPTWTRRHSRRNSRAVQQQEQLES